MLYGDDLAKRAKWQKLFEDPIFHSDRGTFTPLYDERELAYRRIKKVHDAKLFSIYDFVNDPVNLFTAHEALSTCDGSLATKFTV